MKLNKTEGSICYRLPFAPRWKGKRVTWSAPSGYIGWNFPFGREFVLLIFVSPSVLCVVGVQLTFVEFNQSLFCCKGKCHGHYSMHLHWYLLWNVKKTNFWQLQVSTTRIITENKCRRIDYHKNNCHLLLNRGHGHLQAGEWFKIIGKLKSIGLVK